MTIENKPAEPSNTPGLDKLLSSASGSRHVGKMTNATDAYTHGEDLIRALREIHGNIPQNASSKKPGEYEEGDFFEIEPNVRVYKPEKPLGKLVYAAIALLSMLNVETAYWFLKHLEKPVEDVHAIKEREEDLEAKKTKSARMDKYKGA